MNLVQAQEAVEELLECTICMNHFQSSGRRTPKMLPCQHTFCLDCVENIAEYRRLACPTCRVVHYKPINDIPNNFVLVQLLDRCGGSGDGRNMKKCEVCQEAKPDTGVHCKECIDKIVNKELVRAVSLTREYENKQARRVSAREPVENQDDNDVPPELPTRPRIVRPESRNFINTLGMLINKYFYAILIALIAIILMFLINSAFRDNQSQKSKRFSFQKKADKTGPNYSPYPVNDGNVFKSIFDVFFSVLNEIFSLNLYKIMHFIYNLSAFIGDIVYKFCIDIVYIYVPTMWTYVINGSTKLIMLLHEFIIWVWDKMYSIVPLFFDKILAFCPYVYSFFLNFLLLLYIVLEFLSKVILGVTLTVLSTAYQLLKSIFVLIGHLVLG